MSLQYISDHKGNRTAVLIPIDEWKLITSKHKDLKLLEEKFVQKNHQKPSDFGGTLPSKVAEEMQQHIAESRQEWS